MNLDLRTLSKVVLLPAILLFCAYYYIPIFTQPLPEVARLSLPYLPFVLLIIGMAMSIIFHLSREFNLLLLFIIIYIALDKVIWHSVVKVDHQLAYLFIVALIPFNYVYNFFSRERGILNQYGFKKLIFITLQIFLVAWLLQLSEPDIKNFLTFSYFEHPLFKQTSISQPLLLVILISGLILFNSLIKTSKALSAGVFSSYISIISAMHFVQYPQLSTIFIILSELLIIVSITVHAYSLAYLDELTNLPSRRALTQSIASLGKRYTIAMLDIDHFKKFNDKYGHDIGDQVLKKLAAQLRQVRGGKPFRYGGEEFTILFPNKTIDEARLYCDNMCLNISNNPFMLRDKARPKTKKNNEQKKEAKAIPLTITVSVGLAERSDEYPKSKNVIKQADKALYKAKKNGRNQIAI